MDVATLSPKTARKKMQITCNLLLTLPIVRDGSQASSNPMDDGMIMDDHRIGPLQSFPKQPQGESPRLGWQLGHHNRCHPMPCHCWGFIPSSSSNSTLVGGFNVFNPMKNHHSYWYSLANQIIIPHSKYRGK